jgi:hypothetical protein
MIMADFDELFSLGVDLAPSDADTDIGCRLARSV